MIEKAPSKCVSCEKGEWWNPGSWLEEEHLLQLFTLIANPLYVDSDTETRPSFTDVWLLASAQLVNSHTTLVVLVCCKIQSSARYLPTPSAPHTLYLPYPHASSAACSVRRRTGGDRPLFYPCLNYGFINAAAPLIRELYNSGLL